jgi:choline-sulfatase
MNDLLSRRRFIQSTAVGVAGMALKNAIGAPAIGKMQKKPNILWIMTDEHNARVMGAYGNKIVHTPYMDSLAENGVIFDTHYCNSPLCVPSRQSITAGKHSSRIDVWGNSCYLPDDNVPSLARQVNEAGYQSFLCGKQHYDYSKRYGFTDVGGSMNNSYMRGTGKRTSPTMLAETRVSPRFTRDFHPGDDGSSVQHDRKVTAGAVDFLTKHNPRSDKPFFLYTGYVAPHFPLIVPEAFWNRYKGKIPMPNIPAGFLDSLSLNYKVQRAGFEEIDVPDEAVRRGRELYYGLTDWVDNEIGKVLAALRMHPEVAENTIIIYSSDHGENMGEHGMWWKNCMFDQATRVPLVISWPERWTGGQRRSGASSHVDLVQTVVDLAGGRAPGDWDGTSMTPWLDNQKHAWKDYAAVEYYAHFTSSGYVMARQAEWKYTYHTVIDRNHPDQRELYNMTEDPLEFTNLAALPEHKQRIAEMHARLVKELGGDPNETEQRSRFQLARGYNRTDKRRAPAGIEEE